MKSNPTVWSPTTGKFLRLVKPSELQCEQQSAPVVWDASPAKQSLYQKFRQSKIYPRMACAWLLLVAKASHPLIKLAVCHPRIEPLLPLVRRSALKAALLRRAFHEAGAKFRAPAIHSLLEQTQAYRDEWNKIIVMTPNKPS